MVDHTMKICTKKNRSECWCFFSKLNAKKKQNYEVLGVKTRFYSSFSSQSNIGVCHQITVTEVTDRKPFWRLEKQVTRERSPKCLTENHFVAWKHKSPENCHRSAWQRILLSPGNTSHQGTVTEVPDREPFRRLGTQVTIEKWTKWLTRNHFFASKHKSPKNDDRSDWQRTRFSFYTKNQDEDQKNQDTWHFTICYSMCL